jgi:hypothetical protein
LYSYHALASASLVGTRRYIDAPCMLLATTLERLIGRSQLIFC